MINISKLICFLFISINLKVIAHVHSSDSYTLDIETKSASITTETINQQSIPSISPSITTTTTFENITNLQGKWTFPWWYNLTISRYIRIFFRGTWHALRDILFPHLRLHLDMYGHGAILDSNSTKVSSRRVETLLDWALPDEIPEDTYTRLYLRQYILNMTDIWNIPYYYEIYPESVRICIGFFCGFILFILVGLFYILSELFFKCIFRLCLRVTGYEIFIDDNDEYEMQIWEKWQNEKFATIRSNFSSKMNTTELTTISQQEKNNIQSLSSKTRLRRRKNTNE